MSKNLTIFRKKGNKQSFIEAYDETLKLWPVPYEELMIPTCFGDTHIVAAGPMDAEPLILLHGMTFSATMWYPNIESLCMKYRVFALDTIGDVGKGKVTKIMKTRQDTVDWLNDVLYGLKITSALFAGHSMGGWLSMNYAIFAPEKVRKLILFAPASGISKITPKFFLKVFPAILFPSESRIQKEIHWFVSPSFQPDEKAEKVFRQFTVSGTNCVPCQQVKPIVFPEQELQNLSTETLLLVGEDEVIYNPEKMLKKAERLLPNVTTKMIPKAGHGLTIEQYEKVNEAVMSFLLQ
ncbi:alpha/beta fold hydrolase [Neobacillus dielmonensis]|uniref:alpha/beta fold hydrolase n=1 Tax=Neobacillus dielmonensis TaxID=1347369 RepID=UPI0005A5D61E|nr:alpha/beta hydrolase [Neobacillus dielmonensis]